MLKGTDIVKNQPENKTSATSAIVIRHQGEKNTLQYSQETGISRVTLTAWKKGSVPSFGTLMENYFMGTPAAQILAYSLLRELEPAIHRLLPNLVLVKMARRKEQ